ncbi:MAG: carboxypeptidase-like regulatory domain-containing protein, partial [Bacteroidota bacterium]
MKASLLLSIVAYFNYQMICAQISGRVIDKATKEGIPYVSIWVENGNNGATAEEDGKFSLKTNEENNKLIFSALGYEKRILAGSKDMVVELEPSAIQLNEVVLVKKYGTKVIEIGETESPFLKAYENGPRIDIKLFPYSEKYKKTKFIKQLIINTDCRINEAMIKLHLYRVNPNGLPGEELFTKDFVVSVSKGVKKTIFNLSSLHLVMPKEGVFAGFERLKIESNAYEKSVFDANTQSVIVQTSY